MKSKVFTNDLDNKCMANIFQFFVINTPIKSLSNKSISVEEYGWKTPWKKGNLKDALKGVSKIPDLLYSANNYKNMEDALIKANLFKNYKNSKVEKICIYDNKRNQTLSVFYHLRNGLAHGRYSIYGAKNITNSYILLEDYYQERLSARIVLKISTLKNWIRIIKNKGNRKKK